MARNQATFVENSFIQGLVTEATGLNFPEKAVTESWNTRYHKNGNAVRRLGYAYEADNLNVGSSVTAGVCRHFFWKGAGDEGATDFLVIQYGNYINFYTVDSDGNYESGLKSFSIDLNDYKRSRFSGTSFKEIDCDYGDGKLFIVHPYCNPIYVVYSFEDDDITVTSYRIMIRDFEGIEEDVDADTRPTTLTLTHKYNLFNQGWYEKERATDKGDKFPLTYWTEELSGIYPSNADIWWYLKDTNDSMNVDWKNKQDFGNTEAPKGHFIYDAFNIDRSDKVGFGDFDIEHSKGFRPSCVAFFAGRVWYGGVNAEGYLNRIYYTQVIESDKQIGLCHQLNDPTSESQSDLLATDGGVIRVQGMARSIRLFESKNSLFVFASNGVWLISGSGAVGTGFTATDFNVQKMSDTSIASAASLVSVNNTPVWWNFDGIWSVVPNEQSFSTVSISKDNIKTFLQEEVLASNREYIQGAYNPLENTIQWLWRSEAASSVPEKYQYDRILELNMNTTSFYPFKFADQFFSTIFCSTNLKTSGKVTENVTDDGGEVVTADVLVPVTVEVAGNVASSSARFKYATRSTGTGDAFLEESDGSYYDFTARYGEGVKDYSSYFITGAKVHGEGHKNTNINYITVFTNASDDASCKLRGRWDWTNSSVQNKWTTQQEVYSIRGDRDVNRKRLLMRGSGPALQLQFNSVAGKPFDILGWASWEGADGVP